MKEISMRKIKEILRLTFEKKMSHRQISNSLGIGKTTIYRCLKKAKQANLKWPLPEKMSDKNLNDLLYPRYSSTKDTEVSPPDFAYIFKELKRKGVTLMQLWKEYNEVYPESCGYSQYCSKYRKWRACSDLWMPQDHVAGEEVFVDYAGLTVSIHLEDQTVLSAQIFVGVLGSSSYTYTEATASQGLEDWISSHKRMFEFFGGVPEILVPDNLKSGVTKPDLYEPDLNPTYYEMARHYGAAILPARVRKPKDKAKAENGVLNVERKLLAPLRNRKFFSIRELNDVLWKDLEKLNLCPFQKIPDSSRHSLFIEVEKTALRPLPKNAYEFFRWKKETVNLGYHIKVDQVFYSVPHKFVKEEVEIRYNERIVEVFHRGETIAVHMRNHEKGKHVTLNEHRPLHHRRQAECTIDAVKERGKEIGENTSMWVEAVLKQRDIHIKQKKKTCLGMLSLLEAYGNSRLENACKRALYYKNLSYKSVQEILEGNLDQNPPPQDPVKTKIPQEHSNIRGPEYFEGGNP